MRSPGAGAHVPVPIQIQQTKEVILKRIIKNIVKITTVTVKLNKQVNIII